ncbi:uncharacterized protein [Nicotiana tomentosiformis]|uniref:uncharacterized protein n=1 Tax=Nicotiana tomentosiformis TaxID=4098 RepID=UPI00388C6D51
MVRDCPRIRRGAPPQTTQAPRAPPGPHAMVTTPAITLPAQLARGAGRAGKGRPSQILCPSARKEAVASDSIITGSTYSYVSSFFAPYLGVSHDSLSSPIHVSIPMGDSVVDHVYRSCLVVLSGFETIADLLLLSIVDFDVILGMDWFLPYHAILYCHDKTVTLAMLGLPQLEWRVTLDYTPSRVISFLNAQRMVEKGCDVYLAYVRDISIDTPTIKSVLVVRYYPNVFLADRPCMPPDRDIEFGIDLLSGTQPISIPPYRMAPLELKELQE